MLPLVHLAQTSSDKLDIILGWSIIPNMIKSYDILVVTWVLIEMSADCMHNYNLLLVTCM